MDQFQDESLRTIELEGRIQELTNNITQLEAEVRKLRIMLDSANDAIFVHGYTEDNLPGRFIEVNKTAEQRLGYTREELLNMSPADIDKKDPSRNIPEQVKKILPNGELVFQVTHVAKNGKEIPTEINSRLFEFNGTTTAISVARDITERLAQQVELEKKTEELRRKIQEIDLLQAISRVVSKEDSNLDAILQDIVNLLPEATDHPEFIKAQIRRGDKLYSSCEKAPLEKGIHINLMAGNEAVGILELGIVSQENSPQDLDFKEEDKKLFELVAERIGRIIQRHQLIHELETDQHLKLMERSRLEGMVSEVATPVSLAAYGSGPLKEASPDTFFAYVKEFGEALEELLEEQVYKRNNKVSERIRQMAEDLGFMKSGPRDVIHIYVATLKEKASQANRTKAGMYSEWGRTLALELMGYLVSYYQNRSIYFRSTEETKGESQQ